jgi:hypothetical protein|tara:strand:- start:751 stop:1494 length:744 start_codon:yes stop_codon:yes gene_type:complete
MPRKAKKKSINKMYFHEGTEQAIIAYNAASTSRERNDIYNEHLRAPFEKLVESIIHTFKFYYFDIPLNDVKHEVISFMITRLDKYKPGKGKAFSFFSVVVKNWLICHNNNNYKKMKMTEDVIDLKHKDARKVTYDAEFATMNEGQQFFKSIIEYWEQNIDVVFKKQRDIRIAYSIIELMSRVDAIEIFNKKALYILLREISGAKTQHITKVLNTMKSHYKNLERQWDVEGHIEQLNTNKLSSPYLYK